MLQISHLYADYGGKPALEDINLTLESGELLVVLGPSGCGKSPAVITRRTVWCAGRLHPRPDANPAAETLAGDGKAGAVDYPRYRRSGVYGD